MRFSTTLAVFGLATLAQSHVEMNTPIPFGKSTLNNSPLLGDGSDFPCKQRPGVYDAEGANNEMALGSDQPLSFTGSAVHGGGSCQISITYDKEPTKNSVWKVIHSIEGGCPMRDIAGNNGNDANAISPSKYSFKVPNNLPTGGAVLAWTWFNKVGNREMYMNCAPVTLTGGASKRSGDDELMARNVTQFMERDIASYNGLPDMFVANLDPAGTACHTVDNKNVKFFNPGESVEINGSPEDLVPPTNCQGAPGAAPGGGSGSTPTSAASQVTSAPATSAPAEASSAASKPSLPGGVFVTVPAPVGDSQPSATAAPAPSDISSVVPSQASSAAPPTGTGTTGSGSGLSGPCPTEGEWNCIGGTSFQQCASGTWSTVQQLAAGTTCKIGQSAGIDISAISKQRRAIRFSGEHIRRHLRSS
jgi:hypothetical protein